MTPDIDTEYNFGQSKSTYLNLHEQARLLVMKSKLEDGIIYKGANGQGVEQFEVITEDGSIH
jgi:hypothetical protein